MRLVEDARKAWKWFSVQAMLWAGALQAAWMAAPEDMKATLPPHAVQWATFVLLLLGIAGRLVKQEPKP